MKKEIGYLVIMLIICGCNNNIDESKTHNLKINNKIPIVQIDTNKKSGINFTKLTDSLTFKDFYFAEFNNALLKEKITIINNKTNNDNDISLSDTIRKTEIFNKCACIRENDRLTIVFSYKSVWFTSEIFLILGKDSAYDLKYYSGDINVSVDTLKIKKVYISKPILDTSNYIDGFVKLIKKQENQSSKVFVNIYGKFNCGIYNKAKTYYLIPKLIK